MQIMPVNSNTNNTNRIGFKQAKVLSSVYTFMDRRIENAVQKRLKDANKPKMTKQELKRYQARLRDEWSGAINTLIAKANLMRDGIEISAQKGSSKIEYNYEYMGTMFAKGEASQGLSGEYYDTIIATDPKTKKSVRLLNLAKLRGDKSTYLSQEEFISEVGNIDPKKVSEKLAAQTVSNSYSQYRKARF